MMGRSMWMFWCIVLVMNFCVLGLVVVDRK